MKFILTYLLHFGFAKLPRYWCEHWKEFQYTEADQNFQQVSYDR